MDAIDIWRTLLAFALAISGGYMIFVYKGLRKQHSEFVEEVLIFAISSLIGSLTFFLEVLTRL